MDGDLSGRERAEAQGHVVVLGGGITGLAAALRLTHAMPAPRITLIEAADRLGGKIRTEQIDGFTIEGGPDSFLAIKARGVGLSHEVGLADDLQGVTPREKRAFILFKGRLHDLPEGLTGLAPTRLAPLARSRLFSIRGKVRVALDYVLPARRGTQDESLGHFVRRRLGSEAWERLVEPLMAGIYAGDGDALSLAATFPQLRAAERAHGGLIRGVLAARRSAALPPPPSAFLTPRGGLAALVSALEEQLRIAGVAIRVGVAADSVALTRDGYQISLSDGGSLLAEAVILAIPSFAAAKLVADIDQNLGAELAAIQHASTAIVTFAYRRGEIRHPLNGHGYVVPRVEGGPLLACTWSSRKWAARAPEGWELLRVFVGRSGFDELDIEHIDDEALIALARQEVASRLGATATPGLTRVHRWPRGMPQYTMGHPERVARIEARMNGHPGLSIAGNAYHGVGLPDCIASGERAAEAALAHIAARTGDADAPGPAVALVPAMAESPFQ